MPDSATVTNIQRSGQATALVDEGSGFDGLRAAIIETAAEAYLVDAAPERVLDAIRALRARYEEERAELKAVRAAVPQTPPGDNLPSFHLELRPLRARWLTLGGAITGTVALAADSAEPGERSG